MAKANYDSLTVPDQDGEDNVYSNGSQGATAGHKANAMKKLSPKYVTFRNEPVPFTNASGVEETRLVPQIVFCFEKEIELDDKKFTKMYFFLSEWRKAIHDAAGSPAYLQALDEKFADAPNKHQDAFNRISQACTWSVDINDAGFPSIVSVELTDGIKAAAAKEKAKRDSEMSAFGI